MLKVSLPQLVDAARAGQVVSFPTDTLPALAAKPEQAAEIYRLKHRQVHKPLILMAAKVSELWPYVRGTADEHAQWQAMAEQYWPGALTLVLPATGLHPTAMTPANPRTLGIRVPDNDLALEILAATGPLATTSANRSGQPPLRNADDIAELFPQVQVLSAANLAQGQGEERKVAPQPSTVLAWKGPDWQVLREGAIAFSA